jgi:hypothetical protein
MSIAPSGRNARLHGWDKPLGHDDHADLVLLGRVEHVGTSSQRGNGHTWFGCWAWPAAVAKSAANAIQ